MIAGRRVLLKRLVRVAAAAFGGALAVTSCRARHAESEPESPVQPTVTETLGDPGRAGVPPASPTAPRWTPLPLPRGTPSPSPTPAPIAPVALQVDGLNYGWNLLTRELAAAFRDTFPNLTVVWRSLSGAREYPEHVAALRAAGQLGDLLESPSATLTAGWAQSGLLSDLGPLIEADGYDTRELFPGALHAYRWRGKLVGLPFVAHGGHHVLLYDQELLDQAAVDPPDQSWSLESLSAAVHLLTHAPRGPFGLLTPIELPWAYPLLRAFGAELLDPSGVRCVIGDAPGIAFLDWQHHLVRVAGASPAPHAIERGLSAMWLDGRAAMICTSLREAMQLLGLQPTRRVGALALPAATGTETAPALVGGVGYCIPVTSRHGSEALQWIKFMLTREVGVRLFVGGYAEPGSRMASWEDARVLDRFPQCAGLAQVIAHAERERVPENLATGACYRIWRRHVRALLSGALSPEDAARRIASEVDVAIGAPSGPPQGG